MRNNDINMKTITILIPCYNEEQSLPALYKALTNFCEDSFNVEGSRLDMKNFNWEFLFVNDGSSDASLNIIQGLRENDSRVNVINLSRNFGKENALLAGMDYAQGDAVLIMDADLQFPLDVVPEMIYWWEQGYDDVYGERLDRGKEPILRKWFSIGFYKTLQSLSQIVVLPNVGDFRLLSRRAVRAITSLRESQRYTKGLYCWVGFPKKGVPYSPLQRAGGKSSFSFWKLVNLAVDGLTSYTTSPLRISTLVGVLVSLAAFAYLLFILIKTIVWGEDVSGFPTLICVILFLGGMQLLALGIIGEYIGRIFNEAKMRPPYVVESYNDTVMVDAQCANEH